MKKSKLKLSTLLIGILITFHPLLAQERPNVVYILVDNWGWGDIAIQGSPVPSPEIDNFASEGIRFTNFNVQNQCTPSRSALMTGRLPIRSGTQRVPFPGEPQGMSPWEYTIAELFSDAGYATATYGKWHLGEEEGRLPIDQGFDEWYGIKNTSNEASYTSTPQYDPEIYPAPQIWFGKKGQGAKIVKEFNLESRGTIDMEIVEYTEKFFRKNTENNNPFFLYASLTQFHPPLIPQAGFEGKSGGGIYADIQMQVDYNVGKILKAIDDAGIKDNTIVILTGDNGPATASAEWNGAEGSTGTWRGGFGGGYEGGIRTPAMIRWPGTIKNGQRTDEIIAVQDWYPTLAHIIGEKDKIPSDRPIDGIDQSNFILGKQEKSNRDYVITYVENKIFSVKWNYIKTHFYTQEGTFAPNVKPQFPMMYDLRNDPGEQVDLWSTQGFAHIWIMKPVYEIITKKVHSMEEFPNIKPGAEFNGY